MADEIHIGKHYLSWKTAKESLKPVEKDTYSQFMRKYADLVEENESLITPKSHEQMVLEASEGLENAVQIADRVKSMTEKISSSGVG